MKLVELAYCTINQSEVSLCSSHTSYANEKLKEWIDLKVLQESIKEIVNLAKLKGLKVKNQRIMLKDLNEIHEGALAEYVKYSNLFKVYVDIWCELTPYINEDKMVSDLKLKEFEKTLSLRNELRECHYRNKVLSKYFAKASRVLEVLDFLRREKEGQSMTKTYHL